MANRPEHIEVIGNVLALRWDDGSEDFIELEALRRACRCAHCAGEPDVTGAVRRPAAAPTYGESSFEVVSMEWIGNYAIGITWGDGHNTGIFGWDLLRAIAAGNGD